MLRFRLKEILSSHNASRPIGAPRMTLAQVALAIGVGPSTLSNLVSTEREGVTNTATLEALARFLKQNVREFQIQQLFEFTPPLDTQCTTNVDELYPHRTQRHANGNR